MTPIGSILERNIILNGADILTAKGYTQVPNHVLVSDRLSPGAKLTYSYCVIELGWRWRLCAVRCSTDIVPGWLRERRSDAGALSRSSWRRVVRDGQAAPWGLQFWETPSVAN